MMKPPEHFYWMWLVRGFDGLIGLILKPLEAGHKPPEDFITYLRNEHKRIGKILQDHDDSLRL